MQIFEENNILSDIDKLRKAWDSQETFLIIPSPAPVTIDWLRDVVSRFPAEFNREHFGILTSGSTGTPKLVLGKKSRTYSLMEQIHDRQKLENVNEAVLALPLAYSYSLVNQWVWSHFMDRKLTKTAGLANPAQLLRSFVAAEDAMLCLVGSQVPLLRRYIPEDSSFPGFIRLNFAGGPFPQADLSWLTHVFPNASIYHNYGCTEALPRLTIRLASEHSDPLVMGTPLTGIQLKVSDEGELIFRSPYSAVAIADQSSLRLIRDDEDDWLETGDLAEELEDGRFRLLGRNSEVFKRHGEKISLSSIGASVKEYWEGSIAFLIETAPDGETGYSLVLAPTLEQAQVRTILIGIRERFRRPHWPIRVEMVDEIPLSLNNKPDIHALRNMPRQILWKQIL